MGAWSRTARDSLWVRAEANEALDQGKLVQINLDGAKLPLPFTMLHFTDFSHWTGAREQAPWPQLVALVKDRTGRSGKALFRPLRLALTGRESGPEMAALLPLIGRDETVARLRAAAG